MKSIEIGTIIQDDKQNYKIEKELGDGGFAQVFGAKGDDGITYAVKVMLFPSHMSLNSFYNEYDIASRIISPHAIKYYYINRHGNNDLPCFIIMEYAPAGSLKMLIESHRAENRLFTTDELKNIYLQLIDGMIDVSEVAVHRDIKPENILLDVSGISTKNVTNNSYEILTVDSIDNLILKISDYGIAKFEGEDTRTQTFKMYGSNLYYAPELWLNPGSHGLNIIAMDIYAMGVVFYELANLKYPYDYNNTTDPKDMHVNQYLKSFNSNVDPVFKNMIKNMLQKSVKDRYKTWQEIKDYLSNSSIGKCTKRSALAERIINSSLSREESESKKSLDRMQKKKEKTERFKLLLNKVNSEIFYPLVEAVKEATNDKQGAAIITEPELDEESEFYSFRYEAGERVIRFEFEALHDEPPTKAYSYYTHINGQPIDNFTQQILGAVPQQPFVFKYYQDKILLWGIIEADSNMGINVAVIEEKGDPYGRLVMFEYTPNLEGDHFSFPIDKEKLRKLIERRLDPEHSFRKAEFDFKKIEYLISTLDVFKPGSVKDPFNNELRIGW